MIARPIIDSLVKSEKLKVQRNHDYLVLFKNDILINHKLSYQLLAVQQTQIIDQIQRCHRKNI